MNTNTVIGGVVSDLTEGFKRYPLWKYMANRELKLRYARSFLGPLWITLTMAFWVAGLSLLYGGLFGASLGEVAPFITLGVIAWNYLTAVMVEGCSCFLSAKGYLMQSKVPLSTFVWLVFYRNLIVLGHNMTIFVILVFAFQLWPNMNWLWALVGWPILFIAGFGISLFLAFVAARFRDVTPLINSIMTVGFFLTPVMWRPSDLTRNEFIATMNPLAHLLDVFRAPLLGIQPTLYSLTFAAITAGVFLMAGLIALAMSRKQILYWL